MRVMLVCPYSFTLPGGVQGQVLGLADALRRLGLTITVVGPCDGEPPVPGIIPIGRSVPLASNGSVAPLAPDVPALVRTFAAIRAEDPDVLHIHEPISPGPTWAALLSRRRARVGTFHASGNAPVALYRTFLPVVRGLAGRLDIRTAVSDDARAVAERWLGGTCRVLPNAVDVERFAKAEPWPTDERAILFVGRHEERKGLEVLLDAFSQLDRDARLWVAGEGPQTEHLKARGIPSVDWLGRISNEELASRLRAASVFCAPSLYGESFGIVLLEAMAAGAPVVASDISGYRDVARQDREAVLVPPGESEELTVALRRLLDDDALIRRLVETGRERAAMYSMRSLAERYLDLYGAAVARAGS